MPLMPPIPLLAYEYPYTHCQPPNTPLKPHTPSDCPLMSLHPLGAPNAPLCHLYPSGQWEPTLPLSPYTSLTPPTPPDNLHCLGAPNAPYATYTHLAPEYLHSLPSQYTSDNLNTPLTPMMPLMAPWCLLHLWAPPISPHATYTPSA